MTAGGSAVDMRPRRFERPTSCSGGKRSIQLSYARESGERDFASRPRLRNRGRSREPAPPAVGRRGGGSRKPVEHRGEEIHTPERAGRHRNTAPHRNLHVGADETSMSGFVLRYLEPPPEVESLVGDDHKITGTRGAE